MSNPKKSAAASARSITVQPRKVPPKPRMGSQSHFAQGHLLSPKDRETLGKSLPKTMPEDVRQAVLGHLDSGNGALVMLKQRKRTQSNSMIVADATAIANQALDLLQRINGAHQEARQEIEMYSGRRDSLLAALWDLGEATIAACESLERHTRTDSNLRLDSARKSDIAAHIVKAFYRATRALPPTSDWFYGYSRAACALVDPGVSMGNDIIDKAVAEVERDLTDAGLTPDRFRIRTRRATLTK